MLSVRQKKLSRRAGSAGFSLIEVALALFVFGGAVVLLSDSLVSILTNLDKAKEVDNDLMPDVRFVRQKVIQESDLDEFEDGGEIETLSSGTAKWTAEVEPAQVSDLFDVILTITLKPEGKDEQEFVQHLRLLRPTWSDPAERSEILQDNRKRMESERKLDAWF